MLTRCPSFRASIAEPRHCGPRGGDVKKPRGLSPTFQEDLQSGFLAPVVERVRNDRTLCLELRERSAKGSDVPVQTPAGRRTWMHFATVDGEELTGVLRSVSQTRRRLRGSAFWSFGEELAIKWTSWEQAIATRIERPFPHVLVVSGEIMQKVAAALSFKGPTALAWDEERQHLHLGKHSLPATIAAKPPAVILPLDAGDGELLREMLRHGGEAAKASGYGEEVGKVDDRWRKSISAAAAALSWTGLSSAVLEEIVSERLRQSGSLR